MTDTGESLFSYARSVKSRTDFIQFVKYLNADYHQMRERWENDTLESFLGGLSNFAEDMDGYYKNAGESVDIEDMTWRMAAQMLLAASVYGN